MADLVSEGLRPLHTGYMYNVLDIKIGSRGLVDVDGMYVSGGILSLSIPNNTSITRLDLDSGKAVWHEGGRAMKIVDKFQYPFDYASWALAALPDVCSWTHIDAEGPSTMVIVLNGLKLWIVASPKPGTKAGEFTNIAAIPSDFEASEGNTKYFNFKPVLLGKGDCL